MLFVSLVYNKHLGMHDFFANKTTFKKIISQLSLRCMRNETLLVGKYTQDTW